MEPEDWKPMENVGAGVREIIALAGSFGCKKALADAMTMNVHDTAEIAKMPA